MTHARRHERPEAVTSWAQLRARLAIAATCATLAACDPAGAPDAASGLDAGFDAPSVPSDAGTDAHERPDAAAADLVLSPARLDFEMAAPGCTRAAELTLSNEGGAPAGPLSLTIVGLHADMFAIASHSCPTSLLAGADCSISVQLRPVDVGAFEASLEVEASGRVATAELRGQSVHDGCGWPPVARPRSLDFGSVVVGARSSRETISVVNNNHGGSAFEPLRVELTGASAAAFSLTRDTCSGVRLAGGLTCEVEVVMSPSTPGALSASLDVSAPFGGMASVGLSGAGVSGEPPMFEPATNDFGSWSVGASSPTATFTLRNPGSDPTGVASTTIVGANPSDFGVDTSLSTCDGVPLAGGASCVVVVSFAPTAAGARSASLRFVAAPGGTASAALTGTGL